MDISVIEAKEVVANLQVTVRMPRAFGLRSWLAAQLLRLAGGISPVPMRASIDEAFDPGDAGTWQRFSEDTPASGQIVLVRYPEGYRLRWHGFTVWREPELGRDPEDAAQAPVA